MFGIKWRDVPGRLATGGYILNSGLGKREVNAEMAAGIRDTAAVAFPSLKHTPPEVFAKRLSRAEITVGTLLLAPIVPTAIAGAALTAFSGSLFAMYLKTPGLRKPHSLLPSDAGVVLAKDSWMLGLGLGYLIDTAGRCRARSRNQN